MPSHNVDRTVTTLTAIGSSHVGAVAPGGSEKEKKRKVTKEDRIEAKKRCDLLGDQQQEQQERQQQGGHEERKDYQKNQEGQKVQEGQEEQEEQVKTNKQTNKQTNKSNFKYSR